MSTESASSVASRRTTVSLPSARHRWVCDAAAVDFAEALVRLGFAESAERVFRQPDVRLYTASPNAFVTYTVHAYPDGSAILTWEFALGDLLGERGIQIGSSEPLNQYMYPTTDLRGRQDGAWLVGAVEQTEALLSSIRFDRPD